MNPFSNPNPNLTLAEVQVVLGITNPRTVQNWLCSGTFPGAAQDGAGNWLFRQSDVLETRARLTDLRDRNARGDSSLPDECADEGSP